MALTNCKECNKEISSEAKTCPYCGIDNPRVYDRTKRRVGVVVLMLLIFLFVSVLTRQNWEGPRQTEETEGGQSRNAITAKVHLGDKPATTLSVQPKPIEDQPQDSSGPSQPASKQIPAAPTVSQNQIKPDRLEADEIRQNSSADTPQIMVLRMLEYAMNDGGSTHESDIQQIKLEMENTVKPPTANRKMAKAMNAKGLAALKMGDLNQAVKMFEEAHALDESDSEIINNLGFSYLKQGNLDSAQQAITKTLTLSPGRASAWENLGEVFGRSGNVSKAAASFSNAYRFSKDKLKMHHFMKKLHEKDEVKSLREARAKTINWAEKTYQQILKKTELKEKGKVIQMPSKK
jgi:tetratricopeptide (TPR) repeat protein